jgi:hypothetical protein
MKAFVIIITVVVVGAGVWMFGGVRTGAAAASGGPSGADGAVLDCANGLKVAISLRSTKSDGNPWDVGSTADPEGTLRIDGRAGSWRESISKRQDQFTAKLFRGQHVTLYSGDSVALALHDVDMAFNDPIINAEFTVDGGVSFSKGVLEEMVLSCR